MDSAYNVVINSLSVSGVFVAIVAAKCGLKVLVIERTTNVVPELTDTFNLVLSSKGIDTWGENLKNIFFPQEESSEISNPDLFGVCNSQLGNDVVFLAGSMSKGLLRDEEELSPLLRKSFRRDSSLPTALVLSWFGYSNGDKLILADLKKNFEAEKKEGSRAEYLELYWRGNLNGAYWRVNRDIAFLALSDSEESDNVVAEILAKTSSGGAPVRSKNNVYYANRIDLVLVPNSRAGKVGNPLSKKFA